MSDTERSTMVPEVNPRITAYVESGCYVCQKYFANASSLRTHLRVFHSTELPARQAGRSRPHNVKYVWRSKKQPHRRTLMGCPSCWFYCPLSFTRMSIHVQECHMDPDHEGSEDPIDEDESYFDDENFLHASVDSTASIYAAMESLTGKFSSLFK
ncbi:hypothetical protein INT47_007864 [Mucor saturninus]|uniref:C2H2-type domain-containing protein n=1 Tax=Mucor saturninus TaxID=64648 RepID=A0A8H7RE07_9FUNG|nr:hypothetical protein INT47_007864 [Mucor saturninus]